MNTVVRNPTAAFMDSGLRRNDGCHKVRALVTQGFTSAEDAILLLRPRRFTPVIPGLTRDP
jgi:hypothetical protein